MMIVCKLLFLISKGLIVVQSYNGLLLGIQIPELKSDSINIRDIEIAWI